MRVLGSFGFDRVSQGCRVWGFSGLGGWGLEDGVWAREVGSEGAGLGRTRPLKACNRVLWLWGLGFRVPGFAGSGIRAVAFRM